MDEERTMGSWYVYESSVDFHTTMFGAGVVFRPGDMIPHGWLTMLGHKALGRFRKIEGGFYTEEELLARVKEMVGAESQRIIEKALLDESEPCDGGEHPVDKKLADYHRALSEVRKDDPGMCERCKNDLAHIVRILLHDHHAMRTLEADAKGCGKFRLDGSFLPRSAVDRRWRGSPVGCDDQSGEDVCADADGRGDWRP